jgi:hypothetical protein
MCRVPSALAACAATAQTSTPIGNTCTRTLFRVLPNHWDLVRSLCAYDLVGFLLAELEGGGRALARASQIAQEGDWSAIRFRERLVGISN